MDAPPSLPDPPRHRPALPSWALLLSALIAILLLADGAALVAKSGEDGPAGRPAASTTGSQGSPSATRPAPPARVAFARMDADGKVEGTFTVLPNGSGLRGGRFPSVRQEQVSRATGLIVYSKTLKHSYVPPHTTCGFAGCTFGYSSYDEAAIAVALLNGTSERVLTRAGGFDTQPSFSPDGTVIAYLQHSKRKNDAAEFDMVVFLAPEGRRVGALVPPKGYTYDSPVWSPDGRSVAVLRTRLKGFAALGSDVMILPVDGSKPRIVVHGEYRQLAWSHDGRSLAGILMRRWNGTRTEPGEPTGEDLWVIPLDGGKPRNVTRLAPRRTPFRSPVFCHNTSSAYWGRLLQPSWSPDDRQIAFLSSYRHIDRLSYIYDVAVVNADGSGQRIVHKAPRRGCYLPPKVEPRADELRLLGWTR